MASDSFAERGRAYEDSFFHAQDVSTVEKLRAVFQAKRTREELRAATGIGNDQVLDRLVALSLNGQMLTVFRLYPLVEVAWADGSFDKKEAEAVVSAAVKLGVPRESDAMKRLEEWLHRGPTEDARAAWRMFAAELRKTLNPTELTTFRNELLKSARHVAETSGGVLGTFFAVSAGEHKVLNAIMQHLADR